MHVQNKMETAKRIKLGRPIDPSPVLPRPGGQVLLPGQTLDSSNRPPFTAEQALDIPLIKESRYFSESSGQRFWRSARQ